jgi:hypothetical protein
MKKITLLVASVLMTTTIVNATEVTYTSTENRMKYNFDEPISFVERGIEFFVFANGDFDFNTRPDDIQGSYFYRTAGKRVTTTAKKPVNYGTIIEHDSFGRVRRVGNTFINYDSNDRVSRIGTVYMKYNRYGLTQIGGMQISYNTRGQIVNMYGNIKGTRSQGYTYAYYGSTNNDYAYNNYQTSNSDYYYRTSGTTTQSDGRR